MITPADRARRILEATRQAAKDLPAQSGYWSERIAFWERELANARRKEQAHATS